ncbi:TPA: hypothetical protein KOS69_003921 [Clostridioides difficile]|uniref:hypothetical protein n=1 Tax=Clostridioides difficile TaxID=1496 RepID=UPI00097FFF99|nr:hypothetical protein [Clostridioides difficile]ELX4591906.1 hypothetical protein [Clostridioides difficile]MBH7538596.1 hypothetical protein [Clostridioides difficile]MBY1607250.1 hypothetical protein [Clostridioides difficile]MBZ0645497.1 hypothetical protein [Clostridioides difficile]MBZ0649314.1 hypothetical protein [Clostridioides difficile]
MLHKFTNKCKEVFDSKYSNIAIITTSLVSTSVINCFAAEVTPPDFSASTGVIETFLGSLTTAVISSLNTTAGKAVGVFAVFVIIKLCMKVYSVITSKA